MHRTSLLCFFKLCLLPSSTVSILTSLNTTLLVQIQSAYGDMLCNRTEAMDCEMNHRLCKDNNIANDSQVNCDCDFTFYGSCIRNAHCQFASRDDPFVTNHDIYFRQCIQDLIFNNCSDPSFCYVSCSPSLEFNPLTDRVLPVNNYALNFLQIRTCNASLNTNLLSSFGITQNGVCNSTEFSICDDWIPPSTFALVTIPMTSTYVTIDYCDFFNSTASCNGTSSTLFLSDLASLDSFDTSVVTTCTSDGNYFSYHYDMTVPEDCLGSFCDLLYQPPRCSPMTQKFVGIEGGLYLSDPYGN